MAHLIFRWIHVLAGVMWIGHLCSSNFVNAQVAKTYTPREEAGPPELMPGARLLVPLEARFTPGSGLLLIGIGLWPGNAMATTACRATSPAPSGIVIAVVAFFIYGPALEATEERDGRRGGELRSDRGPGLRGIALHGRPRLFLFARRDLRNHHDVERLDADLAEPAHSSSPAVKGTGAAAPDRRSPRSAGCAASTTLMSDR